MLRIASSRHGNPEVIAPRQRATRIALEGVALLEATKGLAALSALLGWLSLVRHDVHRLALELIGHLQLDPTTHYPARLLRHVDELNVTPLRTTVLLGSAYIGLHWIEACGLWLERAWGPWHGALGGAIYEPFEWRHPLASADLQSVLVVVCNIALVGFLAWRPWARRTEPALTAGS